MFTIQSKDGLSCNVRTSKESCPSQPDILEFAKDWFGSDNDQISSAYSAVSAATTIQVKFQLKNVEFTVAYEVALADYWQ